MRYLAILVVMAPLLCGCERSGSKDPTAGPAKVEVGGKKGGVHVDDPASGTKVDVDASGVRVETPDTKVDAR